MKITYLSRTMNRVLGLTVMVFLPGIFVSVCRLLLLVLLGAPADQPRHYSAPTFLSSLTEAYLLPAPSGYFGLS